MTATFSLEGELVLIVDAELRGLTNLHLSVNGQLIPTATFTTYVQDTEVIRKHFDAILGIGD